ncbi:hypothetical protein Ancab_018394 [Ancistrocladus abbreviatus]
MIRSALYLLIDIGLRSHAIGHNSLMELFGICVSSSNQNPLLQNHKTMHHLKTHNPTSIIPSLGNAKNSISKRSLNLSIVAFILSIATPTAKGEEENINELQTYTDYT